MLRVRLKLRMGRAPPRGLPSSVAKPCVRSLHIEQQQQEEEEEGVGEDALVHFVRTRKNLLVITGAGVRFSTFILTTTYSLSLYSATLHTSQY